MAASGTSEEDIKNQHAEAEQLLQDGHPVTNNIDLGEIPLSQKRFPTCTGYGGPYPADSALNQFDVPCFSSRGHIDVAPIVNIIKEGYDEVLKATLVVKKCTNTHDKSSRCNNGKELPRPCDVKVKSLSNFWDTNNAYKNNVHIVRPSHDKWGIKKIILVFCDDFLRMVYEMPWWHQKDLQEAIQPVLDVLQVPRHRVVRCLFASLPPNVTIPVHHDTGAWVQLTHRVHVPIIVSEPNRVLFRCGLNDTNLKRVSVDPGHVFELNNQAKHAVSNCSSDYRVHLILDYVDDQLWEGNSSPIRVRLSPGERLHQTRRTISRECDYGKRPTPSYMILGCQKSGTTSLYEYLNQHPLIVRAKRRETHCLDWRFPVDQNMEEQRKHCLSFYYYEELQNHPSLITGDSTPSYILHPDLVIPRIKLVFSDAWHALKFFVMLRDPVKRCFSHYQMVTSEDGTEEQKVNRGTDWQNKTFEEVVNEDFRVMRQVGLIPYWKANNSVDEEEFEQFVGSSQELAAFSRYQKHIPMNRGSHSPVVRGIYHLQLRRWFQEFSRDAFMVMSLETLSTSSSGQRILRKAFEHLGLPPVQVEDTSPKNKRPYIEQIKPETQSILERFYSVHNGVLQSLLGEEWKDAWPYNTL